MEKQIGVRPLDDREFEKERRFWENYWKTSVDQGVRSERLIWHERALRQFIRFVSPKRLKECDTQDVTDWLRLMAHQPMSEVWKVNQANTALRILFQNVLRVSWSQKWPTGFFGEDESESWRGVPSV